MALETLGVILKRSAYQEDRVLLDLFTECHGKISVLVNRSHKSKYSDQIFQLGKWHLKEGKVFYFSDDYDSVQSSAIQGLNIWSGYYLNELLVRLLPRNHADSALFTYYWRAVKALEFGDSILQEWMLRCFERTLLESLGVMPDLWTDNDGDAFVENLLYHLCAESGFSKFKTKTHHFPILGDNILLINEITDSNDHALIDKELLLIYKRMMRYLLQPLLGNQPLQSKVWLQSLHLRQQEREKRSSS